MLKILWTILAVAPASLFAGLLTALPQGQGVLAQKSTVHPQDEGVLTQKALSLDLAYAITRGALEDCRARGGKNTTVVVVDASGQLKAFLRDGGEPTALHTIEMARRKAYTALTFGITTAWPGGVVNDYSNGPGKETFRAPGGVPIIAGKEVIGAIGVSGCANPNSDAVGDEIGAKAGVAKVADKLK